MKYSFELLGVSPILTFFNEQQKLREEQPHAKVEYLANRDCTLDAFLGSVEDVCPQKGWPGDKVVETVINFWMNNADNIRYWNSRLKDAGNDSLLVARVADISGLRSTFESLLDA